MGGRSLKDSQCNYFKILASLLLATTFFKPVSLKAKEVLIDRLLAEVNGDVITYSEVKVKVDNGPLVVMSPYPSSPDDKPFNIAVNDAINIKLVMMKAEELGLTVSDAELNDEIEKFATRRKMTVAALKQAIRAQGLTFEKYKEDFKMQIIMSRFQGREIMPQVKVTEKDAKLYYMRTEGNAGQVYKLQLRQLFIAVSASDSDVIRESKLELLAKIQDQIASGVEFAELVKLYSDSPNAKQNGGKMPILATSDLSGAIKADVEKLEVGDTTKPIKVPNGYYIFKLESKEMGDSSRFNQAKTKIIQKLRQEEVQKETQRWIEIERSKSDIRVIEE